MLEPSVDVEVIPVAVPGSPGRVVLVLRVEPAGGDVPVVVDGRVLRRLPGQTVAATRDQILALATRSGQVANPAPALNATFQPDRSGGRNLMVRYDFQVRVAGATWLRSAAAEALMFGTDERTRIVGAFDSSRAVRLAEGPPLPGPSTAGTARSGWTDGPRSTTHFSVWRVVHDGTDSHRVELKVIRDGLRVAYAVDMFGRDRNGWEPIAERAPRMTGVEVAATLIAGLSTVAFTLPAAVSDLALEPPHRLEQTHIWLRGDGVGVSDLMAGALTVPAPQQVTEWGFTCQLPADEDALAALVRDRLAALYVDLGAMDERRAAANDVDEACQMLLQ
jgi:hypothetical protein